MADNTTVKKKINWAFWLGLLSALLMAADGLQMLWQPLLPPGIFAGMATVLGISSKIVNYLVQADQQEDLKDDGVINGSNH